MTDASSLPVVHISSVFHIGSLDPADKGDQSYEGHGLSVSRDPFEWERIAKLGGQTWWRLDCDTGAFCDFHAINKRLRRLIRAWGVEQELVTEGVMWEYSWLDEELFDCLCAGRDPRGRNRRAQ